MSFAKWQAKPSGFVLSRGGRDWTLLLDGEFPGLHAFDKSEDVVLCLDGIAAAGRMDPGAFSSQWLVGVEHNSYQIEATYAPAGWSGLNVRARWSLAARHEGIDLQVQVSAKSVGELKALELFVTTRLAGPDGPMSRPQAFWVQPRDPRSAAFSYDGREPAGVLARLTTLPVPINLEAEFGQVVADGPEASGGRYIELAHRHDVARRIIQGEDFQPILGDRLSIRYGLFGHDLEKGVVVRGRLRGIWISPSDRDLLPQAAFHEFMAEPPPLDG
ncbi:MAG: hypothetical protein JO161_05695 [Planctomycetaceae bacterium]|nr:hypothetical protein [Planctomycetaceae bacterium]